MSTDTSESGRQLMSPVTKARRAPKSFRSPVSCVFLFYTLKPHSGVGTQARFSSHLRGSQQVVKGSDPLFQLLLHITPFQEASEVMLVK